MLLPNTNSFRLTRRRPESDPGPPVFLPSTDSFVLARTTRAKVVEAVEGQEQANITDQGKRNFLKLAGVVGAGAIASQLAPNKAQALIMGSSPTTGVVGVKDSTNARINPATEETLDTVLKTSDLTFDAGAVEVKIANVEGEGSSSYSDSIGTPRSGLVDADRHVQVDVLSSALPTSASTESTLQTIAFGGSKLTLHFETVGTIDYVGEAAIGSATSSAVWRIRRLDNTSDLSMEWAGTGIFDQVWDNRASLSYS